MKLIRVQSAKQRPSPFFCGLGTIEVILLLGVQTADMLRRILQKQGEQYGQQEDYGIGGRNERVYCADGYAGRLYLA